MWNWILQHKELISALFSGIGVAILGGLWKLFWGRRDVTGTATATSSPQFNINVSPNISPVISSNQSTAQPTPALQRIEPESSLELQLIDCKAIAIVYSGWTWREEHPAESIQLSDHPNAFVAIFRNKPAPIGREIPSVYHVTGHLIYRSVGGRQQIIDFGTWLGEYTHFTDFKSGESHSLILSSIARANDFENRKTYVLDNPLEIHPLSHRIRSGITTIYAPKERPMIEECCEVEVTLTSKNATVYHGKFSYKATPDGVGEFMPIRG